MTLPLLEQRCVHAHGDALTPAECAPLLAQLKAWQLYEGVLHKSFRFADFHHTMAFVNAVAAIAHAQDHHPDMAVSYDHCLLRWSTHSVGGLSLNDFICAARIDALPL